MLCPLKFNAIKKTGSPEYNKIEIKSCHCEKEKCAWWVETPNKFSNGDNMEPNYGGGCCAIKLIAENKTGGSK